MTQREFDALFERYGPMVFRRASYLLGNRDDAEEATQEVFIRALKSRERFEKRSEVSTWLYRITTNYCLNLIRNRKRRRELFEEHVAPPAPIAPAPQKMLLVRQILAEVEEDIAQAAIYVFVDGLTHQEASEVLGVSRRTVGNLLTRFTERAAAFLAQKENQDERPQA